MVREGVLTMVLYAKVGTGPGGYIRVYRKRKLPEIGEHIRFKPSDEFGKLSHDDKWSQWKGGLVDGIMVVHGRTMYEIERF